MFTCLARKTKSWSFVRNCKRSQAHSLRKNRRTNKPPRMYTECVSTLALGRVFLSLEKPACCTYYSPPATPPTCVYLILLCTGKKTQQIEILIMYISIPGDIMLPALKLCKQYEFLNVCVSLLGTFSTVYTNILCKKTEKLLKIIKTLIFLLLV